MNRWQWTAGLAAGLAASPAGTRQVGARLELSRVRFYRGGETLVEGFCRVPAGWLSPLGGSAGAAATYRVAVSVRDSAGLALLSDAWSQSVSGEVLRRRGASTVEHFRFVAPPGRYAVEVAVTDSESGQVSRVLSQVRTFDTAPPASDLLLGTGLREATSPADTAARAGEIRKGSVFVESSGRPVLTPQQSQLAYYLELYSERAESGSVILRVKSAAGNPVVATLPQRIALAAGGGATRGKVDLGGLPPGEYELEVVVSTRDSAVMRSAAFAMTGFGTDAVLAAPAARDVFAALDESGLDSLYEPLIYLMTSEEQGIYSQLTSEGKRAFLRRFWAARDPTPGTPNNEAFARFYAAITEANQRFREGGAAEVAGWRTDRGRIFIRYGPPDEVLSRPQAGSTRAYEAWKYTRVRARKFVFFDATSFGHYELIWTDERREPSRPNWRDLLGSEAVEDVDRF